MVHARTRLTSCVTLGTMAIMVIALLGGCSSTPATRFYVLAPVAQAPLTMSAAEPGKPSVTLIINDVRLPQYLDRPYIVTRDNDHRLQMFEHEQWGGNLRDDMTRVLAENLGRLLASDRVIAAPTSLRVQPDYRIEVEVLRFEREPGGGGRVRLSARWWLTQGADAKLLASPEASFSGESIGESGAYDAMINSMSVVYGELAQAIARSILLHWNSRGSGSAS